MKKTQEYTNLLLATAKGRVSTLLSKVLPTKQANTFKVHRLSGFNKMHMGAVASVFAGIGAYALFSSYAAVPPNFTNTAFLTGLNEPTNLVFTPDGRMLVLGRRGTIWVAQPGATQVNATPFLQLSAGQVSYDNERGLLGIALDPNFSTNGYYYIYYTEASTSKNRISRFTASGDTTSTATETLIWRMPDVSNIYHQGGSMAFGSDGKLYVSVGDHLDGTKAQDLTSDKGKILRMNSDGSFPTDNPFYDGAGPNRDEIWAYGFRNPFRFSFDSASGRMYEGDVGEGSWEEVNIVTKGANYGWPTCEGTCSTSGMTNPTHVYAHPGGEGSITGGFVYRGNQFPAQYQGAYFFADYTHHWIKYLTLDSNGNAGTLNNFDPVAGGDGTTTNQGDPVAMAMGPDGSLYYADIGPFQTTNTGKIRKITYTAANQAPSVQSAATPQSGQTAPLAVSFSSAGTTDPENQTLTYSWNFGDGATSTQANPSHTYSARGVYSARLTVSDGTNSVAGTPITVTVGRPPVPSISSPSSSLTFTAGQQINFAGTATDPEDGTVSGASLEWSVVFHHEDHIHPGAGPFTGTSGSFSIPTSGHDFTGNTSYEITLTATDADGISASTSVFINPQKVNITYDTNPSGGTITVDSIAHTTPYTFDSLVGIQHSVSASSPQIIGSGRYAFTSWSSGATQSHTMTVPSTARTYTASFTQDTSLPAGMKAAYNIEEGSGSTTVDFSGNGNTANLNGGTSWVTTGKYGNALNFNGTTGYLSVTDSASLDLGSTGTAEAWVKPNLGNWQSIVAKGNANDTNVHNYAIEITPTNTVTCTIGNGSAANTVTSASTLTNAQFVHIACVWTGTTLQLYINGVSANSVTQNVTPTGNTSPLYIGQYGGNEDRFNGTIDEVRIYNRGLSSAEVQADMNSALSQAPPADTTAPIVGLTAPVSGSTITGSTVSVTATATDNVGVVGVQFKIDGGNLGSEDTGSPYSATLNTTTLTEGSHILTAVARDAAGNTTTATAVTVTVDNVAPNTTITSGSSNGPATNVSFSFSSTEGGSTFECKLDSGSYASCTSPKTYSGLTIGSHTFSVRATDAVGNVDASAATNTWSVTDATIPTVSITAPTNGAIVTGTSVSVTATATDNVGVTGVQFKVDGTNIGAEDTGSPYAATLNTTTLSEGSHTLTAVARDAASNTATSTGVSITVDNTAPNTTISVSPANGPSTSVSFSFTSSESGSTFQCKLDSGSYASCTSPKAYSGLSIASHIFSVIATDAVGIADSSAATHTWSVTDATPPIVGVTLPINNATVSGSNVTLRATASDNVGIAGVQFYLDAPATITNFATNTYGGELTGSSPYSTTLNTTTLSEGSHTLTAVARDSAGNRTQASNITITVNNVSPPPPDTTPPTAPTVSSNVTTSSVTLTWSASTDSGVGLAGYRIYNATDNELITLPLPQPNLNYTISGLSPNTNYTYKVVAYDLNGNESSRASGSITTKTAANAVTTPNARRKGDVDGKNGVNLVDLSMLLAHYNTTYPDADFGGSAGTVDLVDLSILLGNYGT